MTDKIAPKKPRKPAKGTQKKKVASPTRKTKTAKEKLLKLKQEVLLDNVEELLEQQEQKKMGIKELTVPYTPSQRQLDIHNLMSENRYGVVVVHRSFGKTWIAINELIKRAWECTKLEGGKFMYVAPEKLQAKNIAWNLLKFF